MTEGEAAKRREKILKASGNSGIDSGESQMLRSESVPNLFAELAGNVFLGPSYT